MPRPVILGALFLWASVTKVPDMAAFAESVANYRIVPPALVPVVAAAVVGRGDRGRRRAHR